MNEYFVMLTGDYEKLKKSVNSLGKVTYISPIRQGFIGIETTLDKDYLRSLSFILEVEEMGYGHLCNTQ